MAYDWGSTTEPIDPSPESGASNPLATWLPLILYVLIPLPASVYFARRNLLLGRGDRRGATRLALFVFAANLLESLFALNLSEVGLAEAMIQWFSGRTFGHCFIHSVTMWFIYVALEPYVRRMWPRMLVSWARLVSGRVRDPLVGRDVLVGAAAAVAITLCGSLLSELAARLGQPPTAPTFVYALATAGAAAYGMAYAASVSILSPMYLLLILFLSKLFLKRTWSAALVTWIVFGGVVMAEEVGTRGLTLAVVFSVLYGATAILVLLRFGLLSLFVMAFLGFVLQFTPAALSLSAWYGSRVMLVHLVVLAIAGYGFLTALAGQPIFGDPIREERS
jgi:serine/threonine-protein kinase